MPTITHPRDFTAERAWGALQIAQLDGVTVRLHWTDAPYHWHVNDGSEVFTVLDGRVEMRWREAGQERCTLLAPGDISLPRRAVSTWPIRRGQRAFWSWSEPGRYKRRDDRIVRASVTESGSGSAHGVRYRAHHHHQRHDGPADAVDMPPQLCLHPRAPPAQ